MEKDGSRAETIDKYISTARPEVRPVLSRIRTTIRDAVPDAEEVISYRMPAFSLGRPFIYFAAFRKHVGIYPPVRGDQALIIELRPYRGEKGNLKFPLDAPIPYELIGRVAATLASERSG